MQPKKPLGLKKAPKLTASRVREIADSLMSRSISKKAFAKQNEDIAKSQLKYRGKPIDSLIKSKGWGSTHKAMLGKGVYTVSEGKLGNPPNSITPEERFEKVKMLRKSASADSIKSVKLKNLIKGK